MYIHARNGRKYLCTLFALANKDIGYVDREPIASGAQGARSLITAYNLTSLFLMKNRH